MSDDALKELAAFRDRSAERFRRAMRRLVRALADGDEEERERARSAIRSAIAETMALAHMAGRRTLLDEAELLRGQEHAGAVFAERASYVFAAGASHVFAAGAPGTKVAPFVPATTFAEALERIVGAHPVLAQTAQDVADAYRQSRDTIAFARAADLNVTRRVQQILADALERGEGALETREAVKRATEWSDAYAATVYRTNLATAYTDGRFAQARDPDVADFIVGFEFVATMDRDTRRNHAAAHGLVASPDDAVWALLRPPLGFSCRCVLVAVTRPQAERRGLLSDSGRLPPASVPPGAHPDPGFRTAA